MSIFGTQEKKKKLYLFFCPVKTFQVCEHYLDAGLTKYGTKLFDGYNNYLTSSNKQHIYSKGHHCLNGQDDQVLAFPYPPSRCRIADRL